jgi:hypothetical protein
MWRYMLGGISARLASSANCLSCRILSELGGVLLRNRGDYEFDNLQQRNMHGAVRNCRAHSGAVGSWFGDGIVSARGHHLWRNVLCPVPPEYSLDANRVAGVGIELSRLGRCLFRLKRKYDPDA